VKTYTDAFTARTSFNMEYRLRRHDGEYRWILECGVPRYDPDGVFTGYIGSAIDISQQKRAETALLHLNRLLVDAHETERARIASELHDDFGQRIAGLTAVLYSLKDRLSSGSDRARQRFAQICTEFSELGRDVGAVSHRLHPVKLELLGLRRCARALCEEMAAQHGVRVAFRETGVPRTLRKDVAFCLFRVLQEALNNAVKHSGSPHVEVTLEGTPHDIRIEVFDHGCGFTASDTTTARGLGLSTMRDRMRMVGGEITIQSQPGRGTQVVAHAPLVAGEPSPADTFTFQIPV
jgi:signal transduction histidine kinase